MSLRIEGGRENELPGKQEQNRKWRLEKKLNDEQVLRIQIYNSQN